MKIACLCCGYFTYEGDTEESILYDICEVCFWGYELGAITDLDMKGGANDVSLNEARVNYKKYKVCKPRLIGKNVVREPLPEELPENNE